jgi:CPA2 family monovalent cation:H+ antiporter-2
MRINLDDLASEWPLIIAAVAALLVVKAVVTSGLVRASGTRSGAAIEVGVMMASPSETSLIVISTAAGTGLLSGAVAGFWTTVTAIGLTVTPLLAVTGKRMRRRVEYSSEAPVDENLEAGRTIIFGFGRVGQMVADMMIAHERPYLAVDNDIDGVREARKAGYNILFGDVRRPELADKLRLARAAALVLTMDDPVLIAQLARRVRSRLPDLPMVARARDTRHAAQLYKAGVTDAVPETLEASLQLAEAVLVDTGAAMGPVIASIHEKRDELRFQIKAEAELEAEPRLGRRRIRDSGQESA